jgi:CheY-like chemotaxis protein
MSHEIRTPINVVLGLSTILGKTSPLSERQAEFIKTLQLSAESLLTIINDLLDFSKIETRTFELENIPFSMESILEEVIALMSVKAAEKGLKFESDFSGVRDKEYTGDPTRIRQIVVNLSGNAIKFTEKGGIVLKVETSPSGHTGYEEIRISVIDTGIGIEPEKLELIFDKFTQADSSISRKYGGTGLGLAIAKTFTEMMGGEINVESTLGHGTTFTVSLSLPARKVKMETAAEPVSETGSDAVPVAGENAPCVLLVDDYAPNVMVASIYLEQFGFECDVAENGLIALEKVKKRKYHAILMDVQMRELDGYQATRAIRQYEKETGVPRTRIIGMTAHALVGDRQKCIDAGMDDYLAKPYHLEDLKDKLAT